MRDVDADLVEKESLLLASALRTVFDAMPDGGRALVVGNSPTNEAATLGLTATVVDPLDKGDAVFLVEDQDRFRVVT